MRKNLIAGNWKMNNTSADLESYMTEFVNILSDSFEKLGESTDILISVPYLILDKANKIASAYGIKVAAQNVNEHLSGAYTGEVSAPMLNDFGIKYCLVGHSERRQYFNETNQSVAEKTVVCLNHGITPIVCIGESLEERESGKTDAVLVEQIQAVMSVVEDVKNIIIAYEPVWAIGTGLTATNEQAELAHRVIREELKKKYGEDSNKVQILYGGSAKPANIGGLLEQENIDGGLVGGASLKPADFAEMVKISAKL